MKVLGKVHGLLGSDRYVAYDHWPTHMHQFCWAHLARLFVRFSERSDPKVKAIGLALIAEKDQMFVWWHRVRDGTLARSTFQRHMRPLQRRVLTPPQYAARQEFPWRQVLSPTDRPRPKLRAWRHCASSSTSSDVELTITRSDEGSSHCCSWAGSPARCSACTTNPGQEPPSSPRSRRGGGGDGRGG
jgi:hypothetical protein